MGTCWDWLSGLCKWGSAYICIARSVVGGNISPKPLKP